MSSLRLLKKFGRNQKVASDEDIYCRKDDKREGPLVRYSTIMTPLYVQAN